MHENSSTIEPPKNFWDKYGLWIRLIVSLVLLWRAFDSIDWNKIEQALPTIAYEWLALACTLLLLNIAIASTRWGFIMHHAGFIKNNMAYMRLYFAGGLINQGLPSTLGGDSYRALAAFKILQSPQIPNTMPMSFLGVLLDRSIGFAGNCILGAIGLWVGGAVLGTWVPNLGLFLLIAMLLGAILLAVCLHYPYTQNLYSQLMTRIKMAGALQPTQAAWGFPNVGWQIILATLIHFITLLAFWACLKACHVNAPLEALLISIPAIGLMMLLPISISGWGMRETSLASMLSLWGLDPSLIILSSLLYGLLILITFLPGLPQIIQKG
jgi:glycosyltransferase 2 family protein